MTPEENNQAFIKEVAAMWQLQHQVNIMKVIRDNHE
jgi:hypothetical protein